MIADLFRVAVLGTIAVVALAAPCLPAEPLRIAILGDSTVCDCSADKTTCGWGTFLEGHFQPGTVKVLNFAKSGRSSKTFIQEGLWEKALAAKPDVVLIQFGHNDSHAVEKPEHTDAATDFQDYLRQYIEETRKLGAVPILVTPMHRRTFNADGTLKDNLKPYADAMKQVAAQKKVPVIDLHTSSGALWLTLGDKKSNEEYSNKPGSDTTHFNEKGARAMAELVMKELPALDLRLKAAGVVVPPTLPAVQMLIPGFSVRELPVKLTNLVHVEYSPDGRLFAAGYDGRVHMLTDSDGDGLEDKVTTFWDKTSADYPLGIVFHNKAIYLLHTAELVRFVDSDGDNVPDKRETVLKDWDDAATAEQPLFLKRRVDYGMGLAIGPDESIYIGMGNAAYSNAYLLDKEGKYGEKNKSHYDRTYLRGCVLKFSPDGQSKEQLLTGVRYLMSMQFNRHGDLFATDQEGATWLPNGNPFDELLHLQPGRHYGFPPQHPKYLPDVIDEPSVFDYAPQHQSLCGFRFNGEGPLSPEWSGFGPPSWRGDALVAGFSRGKLYRTQLVKTDVGYVAQNQLLAQMQSMPADLSLAPSGDMVIASHTGKPDWGTGPQGEGLLYKISYEHKAAPLPVACWSAGPGEFRVAFDRPLEVSQLKSLVRNVRIETGPHLFAGDRYERIRPGYEVVQRQWNSPRPDVPVLAASLSTDDRTLVLNTAANVAAQNFTLMLPGIGRVPAIRGEVEQRPTIDLFATLHGVEAHWKATSSDGASGSVGDSWTGWLPHVDLAVAEQFTQGSSEHERLASLLKQPGTLTLRGQLDLWQMLQPAIQPISKLDYERPIENVTVAITAAQPFHVKWGSESHASVVANDVQGVTIKSLGRENQWLPLEVIIPTGDHNPTLQISWFTDEDARPRAFPLRRFLMPWAKPLDASEALPVDRAQMPELAGGDWERGHQLFLGNIANCSKCHQARGEGGKVGPDLSNLIHRDYDSVLRDIREPSAAINPDYLNYTVLLTDGRVLNGVIHKETDTSVMLADNTGKLIEVPHDDIEEIKPSKVSVMPQDVLKQLTPEQIRDLLVFLLIDVPKAGE